MTWPLLGVGIRLMNLASFLCRVWRSRPGLRVYRRFAVAGYVSGGGSGRRIADRVGPRVVFRGVRTALIASRRVRRFVSCAARRSDRGGPGGYRQYFLPAALRAVVENMPVVVIAVVRRR